MAPGGALWQPNLLGPRCALFARKFMRDSEAAVLTALGEVGVIQPDGKA